MAYWHDHCACKPMAVYSRDAAEVLTANDLYRQWLAATRGKSGHQAFLAFRRYWDGKQRRDGLRITA